jgi:hypothetical protein
MTEKVPLDELAISLECDELRLSSAVVLAGTRSGKRRTIFREIGCPFGLRISTDVAEPARLSAGVDEPVYKVLFR